MASQLDNPKTWATGADAPTEKQTSFLQTLAKEKGVEVDANNLNKGEASAKINELKNKETADPDATADEPIQDPKEWATGDDPATGKQTGYIAVMAKEAGEDVKTEGMGKAEASEKIGELKKKTGM
ncbi:uncharacterized protein AB675_8981 [Cyphellophora attinorum]|uniref:Uncharacterized protein n=1 Tax=Cyphellophora attinorum TaxID=1664694 RepID=A0A0N0NH97_9EURO|nr:uncharacterized protein AB675_8981 [Phialophora attinorum]KPI34308.1 hypothetical protein AB675_8981 [Phialophora attinorum]